MLRRHLDQNY